MCFEETELTDSCLVFLKFSHKHSEFPYDSILRLCSDNLLTIINLFKKPICGLSIDMLLYGYFVDIFILFLKSYFLEIFSFFFVNLES